MFVLLACVQIKLLRVSGFCQRSLINNYIWVDKFQFFRYIALLWFVNRKYQIRCCYWYSFYESNSIFTLSIQNEGIFNFSNIKISWVRNFKQNYNWIWMVIRQLPHHLAEAMGVGSLCSVKTQNLTSSFGWRCYWHSCSWDLMEDCV